MTAILAADWSVRRAARAVALATTDPPALRWPPAPHKGWTLYELLEAATAIHARGPALVAIDVALGVTPAYLAAAGADDFVAWLAGTAREGILFWNEVQEAQAWSVRRPWFRIPRGPGTRKAYERVASGMLLRACDLRTGAKPPFCVAGIPGTVGAGTRALWRELAPRLEGDARPRLWPFDGPLDELLRAEQDAPRPILAEAYPRLAYAVALDDQLPAPTRRVAKSKRPARDDALALLRRAPWVARHGVELPDLEPARESEDAFDALLTAAALLRARLEGHAVDDPRRDDPVAAGGILLESLST